MQFFKLLVPVEIGRNEGVPELRVLRPWWARKFAEAVEEPAVDKDGGV